MVSNKLSFEGQRVLITAGASGIGKAIAKQFAELEAQVHIVDVDEDAIEQCQIDFSDTTQFTCSDVSNQQELEHAFKVHNERFGGLEVLVNCAGIKGPTEFVENIELADWQRCIDVNLLATFMCAKFAVPLLKKNGSGSIINLSSTAGWHGYPLRSPYAAAKWAVIGLTKSLAMELGPFGIRANAICPGTVDGARMDKVIADEARIKGVTEEDIRSMYTKGVSLRTMIQPEDIAQTAIFLASNAASKITGQAISVDGHLENTGGLDM